MSQNTGAVQTSPDELLLILASIKAAEEVLVKQKEDVQTRLIDMLEILGKTNLSATASDGRVVKGTVVSAERIVIDEDLLAHKIGFKLWEKVSVRKLDKALLEAHVVTKAIDQNDVADCSEIKHNKPYIKVSGDLPTMTGIQPVTIQTEAGKDKPALKRVKARKAKAAATAASPQ